MSRLDDLQIAYNNWANLPQNPPGFFNSVVYIQNVKDAAGTVLNFDFFPVKITQLPTINGVQWTQSQLLEYFRLCINQFIDNNIATFQPFNEPWVNDVNLWNSSNPVGALVHLNMDNDGSVIVSHYSVSPTQQSNVYYVSTLVTPLDGLHPVSGNRKWGIQQNSDGTYMFYTSAVDRMTTGMFDAGSDIMQWLTTTSGFDKADNLWHSMQQKMALFINNNSGAATYYDNGTPGNLGEEISRPQWSDIQSYLRKGISYEELRIRMGC